MTVPYRILIACDCRQEDIKTVKAIAASTFDEIDRIYNKWNPASELSAINAGAGNMPLKLSSELYSFFQLTDRFVHETRGKFDPTVEPVQKIWKRAFEAGRLPEQEEIAIGASSVGWDKISIKDGAFVKHGNAVQLDFGGIVKGFTVDMLVQRYNAAGYMNVFVDWGGEIRTSGRHPDNRPWKVCISRLGDPDPSAAFAILDMEDAAVATSGDYLQQWTVGKETYFHIIDPATLRPLQATHSSIASVTVMAPTCVEADVLATTAMLFPSVAEAEEWAARYPHARFWIFSRESLAN